MEKIVLNKTKVTNILSFLNKVEVASSYSIFYNDGIYPISITDEGEIQFHSDKLNGYNQIENSFLPVEENVIYIYTEKSTLALKESLKETGIKRDIVLVISDESVSININGEVYILLSVLTTEDSTTFQDKLYPTFQAHIDELHINFDIWKSSTRNDIMRIIQGNVVKLTGEIDGAFTEVRISRSNFSLIGTVKLSDEEALSFDYSIGGDLDNPYVIIIVNYKKFRAIHAFNYIHYIEEE